MSSVEDVRNLAPLPEGSAVLHDRPQVADDLIPLLSRTLDSEAWKKIDSVRFLEEARGFVVRMYSGKTYMLKLVDIDETDDSPIEQVEPSDDGYYFEVTQSSGNRFEVPWDDILYHCEPGYAYYKGSQNRDTDVDRGARIGRTVRELRTARGLNVSQLAESAGMKRPNVSRLEHGRHLPSLETLERLADALDMPVARLLARPGFTAEHAESAETRDQRLT